jgi:hypothetical protein
VYTTYMYICVCVCVCIYIYIYIVISSQVLFHNGSLLHSEFNIQLLITVTTLLELYHTYDRFSNYSEYFCSLLASALVH